MEEVAEVVVAFVDKVTGCDCGGLTTVTCATDAAARSSAVTAACNRSPLTKVVARAVPFQFTVEFRWKWFPFTTKAIPGVPTAAVAGAREETDGVWTQSPQETLATQQAITTAQAGNGSLLRESDMVHLR